MNISDILSLNEEGKSIVAELDDNQLTTLSSKLSDGIASDYESMDKYLQKYKHAIELASMKDELGDKTFPFVGASRVMSQLLVEAAIDFNARSAPDIIGTSDICKVRIKSMEDSPEYRELQLKSKRVSRAVNNILTEEIPTWRDSEDKELFILAIVGTTFRKTWFDSELNKPMSKMITPDKLIFDHNVDHFKDAQRVSFTYDLSRNEFITAIRSEEFTGIEEKDLDEQCEKFTITESHCLLDIDDDGYCEPYIANLYNDKIVSIYPLYSADDVKEDGDMVISIDGETMFTQTIFMPDPFGSCMGLGWGILLSDTYKTINTNMRQMVDAATLQNVSANSGFIDSNSLSNPRGRTEKGKVEMIMGQFTSLKSTSARPLKDSIVHFPFAGPSASLYQMMESMKQEVRSLTSGAAAVEASPNEAAELYIARLQQGLKVPNSIMIRVYSGITKQCKRVYDIIYDYYSDEMYQDLIGDKGATIENDFEFEATQLSTVADPSLGSEQERIAKESFIYQQAKELPQVYNLRESAVRLLTAMSIPDIESILPPVDPNAVNPLEQMQQQFLLQQQKNEALKAEAQMLNAQIKMADLRAKVKKTEAEVVKIYTEAAKNVEDIQSVQLDEAQKVMNLFKTLSEEVTSDYSNGTGNMASGPGNEGVPSAVVIDVEAPGQNIV